MPLDLLRHSFGQCISQCRRVLRLFAWSCAIDAFVNIMQHNTISAQEAEGRSHGKPARHSLALQHWLRFLSVSSGRLTLHKGNALAILGSLGYGVTGFLFSINWNAWLTVGCAYVCMRKSCIHMA